MPYLNEIGEFKCKVIEPINGWFGETPAKGTAFIRIPLEVVEGPCKGQHITYNGWLTDKNMDRVIKTLASVFGFDGNLNALADGTATFADKLCSITTEMESYEGKLRCKVAWLNNVERQAPKPMDSGKLKSLLGRITPKAKAIAKEFKPVVVPAAQEQDYDPEVPF